MDANRFDTITRLFASRRTRRATVAGGVGFAASAIAGRTLAQDATPAAAGDRPHSNATAEVTELFTQAFEEGTWSANGDDTYTLTLTGTAAQTIYFADRPNRFFGTIPMQNFIDTLNVEADDPPNAALITRDPDSSDEDVLIIELMDPSYDVGSSTLTYQATVLTDYQQGGLTSAAIRQQDYDFPASFGQGGLFIDGYCKPVDLICNQNDTDVRVGTVQVGTCYHFPSGCSKCHSAQHDCASAFPNQCTDDDSSTGCHEGN